MEVGFVGRELMGGNLGQRIVGFQLLDDAFPPSPIVVEAIEPVRSKTKVGDESVIGLTTQREQLGLCCLFLRQALARHHKAVRAGAAVRWVGTLGDFQPRPHLGIGQTREQQFEGARQFGDDDELPSPSLEAAITLRSKKPASARTLI